MAVKLADTLAPMGDFEIAEAKDISVMIGDTKKRLQQAIEDGDIGGAGNIVVKCTEAQYGALLPAQKALNVIYSTEKFLYYHDESLAPVVDVEAITDTIGDLEELKTEEKGSVVGAINEVSDSLVDIEGALEDKADASELVGLKRRYNSIDELNAIKKKSLILVNGEDNTQKILDALDVGEVLSDYFSNGGSTSRFGINASLGTYFIITFEKNDNGYAKITAKSTTSNTVLVRYHNANELSAWQELATMDKVQKGLAYTINSFTCPANSQKILVDDVTAIGVNWSVGWSAFIMNRNGFVNFNLFGDGNTLYLRNNQGDEVTGKIVLYFNYT